MRLDDNLTNIWLLIVVVVIGLCNDTDDDDIEGLIAMNWPTAGEKTTYPYRLSTLGLIGLCWIYNYNTCSLQMDIGSHRLLIQSFQMRQKQYSLWAITISYSFKGITLQLFGLHVYQPNVELFKDSPHCCRCTNRSDWHYQHQCLTELQRTWWRLWAHKSRVILKITLVPPSMTLNIYLYIWVYTGIYGEYSTQVVNHKLVLVPYPTPQTWWCRTVLLYLCSATDQQCYRSGALAAIAWSNGWIVEFNTNHRQTKCKKTANYYGWIPKVLVTPQYCPFRRPNLN